MKELTKRKYEKGTEIINKKGLKLYGVIDYYKLVIGRKQKPRKTDDCIKYICYIYDNKDNFNGCFILKETTIDEILLITLQ